MDDIVRLVREAGTSGMQPSQIAKARGVNRQSVERPLQRLLRDGRLVNFRPVYRQSLYFVPEFAPKAEKVYERPAQRMTSIRDANVRMPAGDPIITAATKITRETAPIGRYEFKPPSGWTGQITRDWRERRMEQQR
jgi:23S rRNA-/tRNA-specific pseudouridylate synthase